MGDERREEGRPIELAFLVGSTCDRAYAHRRTLRAKANARKGSDFPVPGQGREGPLTAPSRRTAGISPAVYGPIADLRPWLRCWLLMPLYLRLPGMGTKPPAWCGPLVIVRIGALRYRMARPRENVMQAGSSHWVVAASPQSSRPTVYRTLCRQAAETEMAAGASTQ